MQDAPSEVNEISVLDNGSVRLIDSMGDDLSVVRAARVSYAAEWRTGEDAGKDAKLIKYLWSHGHTSPFEHVCFTFEVKAPIFVFRQWHRHRVWAFNELSARYTELPDEYYIPRSKEIGFQSSSSKQAREIKNFTDDSQMIAREQEIYDYDESCRNSFTTYHRLLDAGWPREIARAVLPVSAYSSMFATVSLLNLFKFFDLRLHEHAQFEIRQYAQAMLHLIKPIVPSSYSAWMSAKVSRD